MDFNGLFNYKMQKLGLNIIDFINLHSQKKVIKVNKIIKSCNEIVQYVENQVVSKKQAIENFALHQITKEKNKIYDIITRRSKNFIIELRFKSNQ